MLILALGSPTAAQTPTVRGAPIGCTYATCAIRLETGFFSARLVRGVPGEEVARLGGFGGAGAGALLTGPDSAAAYARSYMRARSRGDALWMVGAVAAAVIVVRQARSESTDTDAAIALVGVGFVVASVPFQLRAQRSLSRAVWWYNSALPH